MRIAVIIPVYNEAPILDEVFARIERAPVPTMPDGSACERTIYLVDDGSTDGSGEIVKRLAERAGVRAVGGGVNRGKGKALSLGFAEALNDGADVLIVQDADFEYDPADHAPMLAPVLDGRADAVIGTRFLGQVHRVLYFWHSVGNRVITIASNMLSDLNLSDIECGFKAFTRDVAERLEIREHRFGVEPEIVAKLARMRLGGDDAKPRPLRIYEVPVSYAGRTYAEGKKIGWRDGVSAMRCIVKYNVFL